MLAATYKTKLYKRFMGRNVLHTEELLPPTSVPETLVNCSNNHTVNVASSQDFIMSPTSKSFVPVLKWLSGNPRFLFCKVTFLALQVDKYLIMWPQLDFKGRRQIVRSQWWLSVFNISRFWETWDVSERKSWDGCHGIHQFKRQCCRKLLSSHLSIRHEENILVRHFESSGDELLQQNHYTKVQFIKKCRPANKVESIIPSLPGPLWLISVVHSGWFLL